MTNSFFEHFDLHVKSESYLYFQELLLSAMSEQ